MIVALIGLALIGRWLASRSAIANARNGRPATAVNTAPVTLADMPETLSAIGTVTPVDSATVKPQLAGNVFAIRFREGSIVHAGQVIAEIDPRPYRLALQSAKAALARDEAALSEAERDLARYQKLGAEDSIARQQIDTQAATVKQDAATVAVDKAAIGTAELNLRYTTVTAPFTGLIGLKQVTLGAYVTPNDTNGIAVVNRIDPIDIVFALPQSNLAALHRAMLAGAVAATAYDADTGGVIAQGTLASLDNQVNTSTGTINAKARFANASAGGKGSVGGKGSAGAPLYPNQFVNVKLLIATLHQVPVVPVSAVRHGAPGDFLFTVSRDSTVRLQVVRLGPSDGTRVAIVSGVKPGDTVVTEGADGLDNGSKVRLPGAGGKDHSGAGHSGESHAGGDSAASPDGNTGAGPGASSPHPHRAKASAGA